MLLLAHHVVNHDTSEAKIMIGSWVLSWLAEVPNGTGYLCVPWLESAKGTTVPHMHATHAVFDDVEDVPMHVTRQKFIRIVKQMAAAGTEDFYYWLMTNKRTLHITEGELALAADYFRLVPPGIAKFSFSMFRDYPDYAIRVAMKWRWEMCAKELAMLEAMKKTGILRPKFRLTKYEVESWPSL